MTEAYAIKGPDGIDASSVQETESECWLEWYVATEMGQDMSARHGYTCVPVTVSEKGEAEALLREAGALLNRYRKETPLGNQPHMIAEQAVDSIQRIDAYLSRGQG